MGFRSMLVTSDYAVKWPDWFREKWADTLHAEESGAISSKFEIKNICEVTEDLRLALNESGWDYSVSFIAVWLHECGGVTRVQFEKDETLYSTPTGWELTDGIDHSYCYGCSDAREFSSVTLGRQLAEAKDRIRVLKEETKKLNEACAGMVHKFLRDKG